MENKKSIPEARADHNGLSFHSQNYNFFYTVKQTKKGKITKQLLTELETSEIFKIRQNMHKHPVLFLLILLLFFFFLSFITKKPSFALFGIYFLIWNYKDFFDFCTICYIMQTHPLGRLTAQYHSAEHMAINAYTKYQRVPTLSEIEASSPFSKSCGSLISINPIIFYFINSILFSSTSLKEARLDLWIFSCIFFNVLFFIGKKKGWFRFLECFVLRKPTKKQLRLAQKGLEFFDQTETLLQELQKNPKFAKYFDHIE